MAASRARLEALLARVQKRATEPRSPSAAVAPVLEAIQGGNGRDVSEAPASEPPASVRAVAGHGLAEKNLAPQSTRARSAVSQSAVSQSAVFQSAAAQNAMPENEVGDEDIEEYDEELIEIIDDAEVIPQAAAVARAIEPAAFGAAVDRRPSAPIRSEIAPRAAPAKQAESLRPEAVAARPIAPTDVARIRGVRRELRHSSFVELLDASLKLG